MGSIGGPAHEPYRVQNNYHSKSQYLRVICAGAGATGLCLAYKMKEKFKFENYDLVCYEKNEGIGGTWYENRYPGCACDVPAHAYTYSFEPNADWSTFYAYGPEIRQYFEGFAQKHNLMPYVQLKSRITKVVWDESEGIYNVELIRDGQRVQDWCHVFINGTGFLNDWKWPKIPGLEDFKGTLVHSANWDTSIDWTNKRVAVIGTGSSAIQIVPQVQKTAKHLTAFMRSVTWISPPVGGDVLQAEKQKGGEPSNDAQSVAAQYYYSEDDKKRFREDPQYHLEYRQKLEGAGIMLFDMFIADSETSIQLEGFMKKEMIRRIGEGHEVLKAKLIPSWPPGCRRITPGDGYLEALVQPNVTTVHHEIEKIDATGVLDESGVHHDVDMLVCATGFNLAFSPPFEVLGLGGVSMCDFFNSNSYGGPPVYLATAVPNFPNFFIVNGVRGNWASGTALPSIEICCEYILRCCKKIQSEHLKSLEVRQEPVDQLYEHIDAWHENSVWNKPCKSWYKNNIVGGKLWIWAGSGIHFMKTMKGEPKFEHYNIKYKSDNMWSFLGNGRVQAEMLAGTEGYAAGQELFAKLCPYMRTSDHDFEVD